MPMIGRRAAKPSARPEIQSRAPTRREQVTNFFSQRMGDDRDSYRLAETIFGAPGRGQMGVADLTPLGLLFAGDEAGRRMARPGVGNLVAGAGELALAAIPVPGAAKAKGMFGAGKRAVAKEVADAATKAPTNSAAREKFLALVEETRRREAQAEEWAATGQPIKFFSDDGRTALVSPDLQRPGGWRVTSFSRNGEPWGHAEFDNASDAFKDAYRGSFSPTRPPPKVTVKEARGNGMFDILHGYEKAGELTLASPGNFVDRVQVDPAFRRQGIGSAAYDAVERQIGRPLIPSPLGLSAEAAQLWRKRLAGMDPATRNRLLDEAYQTGRQYGLRDEHLSARLEPLR